ncbi:MAG TPA: SRPBCC family protein [Arthrobacter sp.]|jgi:carbon monoxide dehydrogenase subunit G
MKAIRQSIQVARRPEEVFSYATDFRRFPEWQVGAVSASPFGEPSEGEGASANVVRRVGPRKLARTESIRRYHPPRTWTVQGIGGPLVANVHGTIEPVQDGQQARVTIDMDFEGHGIGRFFIPSVAGFAARRQLPKNLRNLKRALEPGPTRSPE